MTLPWQQMYTATIATRSVSLIPSVTMLDLPSYRLLENVQHCGGKPEQAATMATHDRLSFTLKS